MASLVSASASKLPKKAGTAATELIREAIIDGRLAPGQRLKEEEIAQELGISRTPVREALLVLQAEGLVEAPPNRGARVREYAVDDLEEVYRLRALLESYAARRAASRISREQLQLLQESCRRFETLRAEEDMIDLVKENLLFHNTILEAAGSEQLRRWAREVIEIPLVYKSFFWYSPEQRLVSEHYHKQITRALGAGDGERAELIMKEHVLEALDFLLAQVAASRQREAGE